MTAAINIPADAIKDYVQAAILQSITDDHRDQIMAQAIQYLMTPAKSSGFGTQPSPLQQAFDGAVSQVAYSVVRELFETNSTLRDRVRDAAAKAISEMTDDVFTEALGHAFAKALRRERD